jgi:hypothetical protein
VKDRHLLKRLERLERILGSPVSAKELVLRSTPWHVLEELEGLLEAGEVEKAGRVWTRAARGGYTGSLRKPSGEPARPRAAGEPRVASVGQERAPVAQEEPRVEEPPVAADEADVLALAVDPDPPRPEMVAAPPHSGPRVVYGHAINLEAVEEQQPEPRPEMVRAPEPRPLGPELG